MRKGNKTRLIVALLTAALMLNAVAFAQVDGVETEFELFDVPNSLDETVEPAEVAVDDEVAEIQAALMAAADEGQVVEPGKVVVYNGKAYRIKADAANIMTDMGAFDTKPNYDTVNNSSTYNKLICEGTCNFLSDEGHNAPGCMELQGGASLFIWRHQFDPNVVYVYSAWWKLNGDANFDDNQRHLAGCLDIDTGSVHYNLIGDDQAENPNHDWQQDICVFKGAPSEARFLYVNPQGNGSILVDDMYAFEVEPLETLEVGTTVIENADTWETSNVIPMAGVKYNCVVNYTANTTLPIALNGVLVIYKDGKLSDIIQRKVNCRTATLAEGDLTSASGTVSIPFMIPEGEDVSKYSCTAYLSQPGNPFYVYGAASDTYAVTIYGAEQ